MKFSFSLPLYGFGTVEPVPIRTNIHNNPITVKLFIHFSQISVFNNMSFL